MASSLLTRKRRGTNEASPRDRRPCPRIAKRPSDTHRALFDHRVDGVIVFFDSVRREPCRLDLAEHRQKAQVLLMSTRTWTCLLTTLTASPPETKRPERARRRSPGHVHGSAVDPLSHSRVRIEGPTCDETCAFDRRRNPRPDDAAGFNGPVASHNIKEAGSARCHRRNRRIVNHSRCGAMTTPKELYR